MVHALEEIHRLLRPDGTLIEIHPAVEVPFVEVRSSGELSSRRTIPGSTTRRNSGTRRRRSRRVVDRGVFVLEERRRFELRTHAASVKEMRDTGPWLDAYDPEETEESWSAAQDEMYARAQEALERSPGAELVYVEPATMSRLVPRTNNQLAH